MKKRWPNSIQYAFEPISALYNKAKYNTLGLNNFNLHKKALYSKNGQTYIEQNEEQMLEAATLMNENKESQEKSHKIQLTTLDSFIKENKIAKIDLLFLDTEGSEDHVLAGAKKTLKHIDVIYIELNFFKREGWANFDKINSILEEQGFKLASIYNNCSSIDDPIKLYAKAQANGLYVKKHKHLNT